MRGTGTETEIETNAETETEIDMVTDTATDAEMTREGASRRGVVVATEAREVTGGYSAK